MISFFSKTVTTCYFDKNVLKWIFDVVLNAKAIPQRKKHRKKPVIESLKEDTLAQVFSHEF